MANSNDSNNWLQVEAHRLFCFGINYATYNNKKQISDIHIMAKQPKILLSITK